MPGSNKHHILQNCRNLLLLKKVPPFLNAKHIKKVRHSKTRKMKWLCQLQFQAAFGNLHHTPTKHPQCLQLIPILHETYPLHVLTKDGNVWEFTLLLTFSSLPHKPGMDLILYCWIRNMNNGSFPVVWHINLPAYDHNSTFRLGWQAMLTNQHLRFLHGRKETILGKVDEQLQVTLTFLIFVD